MYGCLEGEIKSLKNEIKNLEGWQIYEESFFLAWSTTLSMVSMKTTQCEEFKQPLLEKKVIIYYETNSYIPKNVSSILYQVCRFLH
jgi:hypothetical protein